MGIETGPIERNGRPKASTEVSSTQVTVPVADRSMSPVKSSAATADPGERLLTSAVSAAAAPEGTIIQPAADASRDANAPPLPIPPTDMGNGSGSGPSAATGRSGLSRSSMCSANFPVAKVESSAAVELAAPEAAAPPMGNGGDAGTWRMSSMFWIGVMPQIGSLENGQ